jgi:hypothetical protein
MINHSGPPQPKRYPITPTDFETLTKGWDVVARAPRDEAHVFGGPVRLSRLELTPPAYGHRPRHGLDMLKN